MPRRLIAGLGLLLLTSGCFYIPAGLAADLPRTRPLPTLPDAKIMARESSPRWETRFNAALVRAVPPALVGWSFYGVLIAF